MKQKHLIVTLKPGDIGGRGCHPADPTGVIFGLKHWPLPQPHERGNLMNSQLYMVIDLTELNSVRICYIAHAKEAAALGRIQKAAGRQVIGPPLEGRGFAKLSLEQLQYLFWNMTQTPPSGDFETLCKACLEAAEKLPLDKTPLEDLEREVRRLYPDESAPTKPKTDKSPKEPKAPGMPAERPKATSTTGMVWDIADAQFAALCPEITPANVDWKAVRAAIVTACEKEGINSATAATQYSKWRKAKEAEK